MTADSASEPQQGGSGWNGSTQERLTSLQREVAAIQEHNSRLSSTLRDAREQIVTLKAEIDRLAQPPGGYGVFLEKLTEGVADIAISGISVAAFCLHYALLMSL